MKNFLKGGFLLVITAVLPALCYSQQTAFIMSVEDVFNIAGAGVMVSGKVENGTIKKGMEMVIIGKGDSVYAVTVYAIYKNNKEVPAGNADDKLVLNVKGVKPTDIKRGMVVSEPGFFKLYKEIEATVTLQPTLNGGLKEPLKNGQRIQLMIRNNPGTAIVSLLENKPIINQGETGVVRFLLEEATPLLVKDSIILTVYNRNIGKGIINGLIR